MADAARASEAAADSPPGKWAPPPSGYPASPPPQYGGLFPSPTTGATRRGQTRWITVAVFVIAVMGLPIAIFFFSAHQVSRGGRTTLLPVPGISSAGPTPPGTMPSASVTEPSTAPTSTAPAGDNVTISGISEVRAIACNGGTVNISGITNNVVITGHCANVLVSGIQNQVTVDAADMVQASGSGNQVTYHTGSPTIENSGFDNVVKKG